MGYSVQDLNNYAETFIGNTSFYGEMFLDSREVEADGKVRMRAAARNQELTATVINSHLIGERAIGASPLSKEGTCRYGILDIDLDYKEHSYLSVVQAIYDWQMPLLPIQSKSGALHVYLFLEKAEPPEAVIECLRQYSYLFGCPPKTEIFPKQKDLDKVDKPSWVNLPYFNGTRCLLSRDGSDRSLADAIMTVQLSRTSTAKAMEKLATIPYLDAPPCVKVGCILRDVPKGTRNNWMFSVGVYWMLKDPACDLEEKLLTLNATLNNPMEEDRVRQTLVKGLARKTYFYKCTDGFASCNKALCRKADFGIDSNSSTGFDFGDLNQFNADPPYYEWEVNGQKMQFYTEAEILNQNKFREFSLRLLGKLPRQVDDAKWTKIVNKASENRTVVEVDRMVGQFSTGSIFYTHLYEFFHERVNADNPSQLADGRTWEDQVGQRWVFSAASVIRFIREVKDFTSYKVAEIGLRLESLGAKATEDHYWSLPFSAIPKLDRAEPDIDFHDKEQEGDIY